jgi:membrane protease YdiL (CAAX protease family)
MTSEDSTQMPADASLPQDDIVSPPAVPRWRRIACNPLLRILIFVALAAAFSLLARWVTGMQRTGLRDMAAAAPLTMLGQALRACLPIVLAYVVLVRVIEGRRVDELAWPKLLPHSALGLLAGAGLMGMAAGLMAVAGSYRVEGIDASVSLWFPLVMVGIVPGITEELIFRGVLFRIVEESLGTWIAIAISGALFGLIHFGNPNATWWSSVAIALEAGILLGMLYAWMRSLYVVMGLHAAWNFTQGGVLDIAVSGHELPSLLKATTPGPEWVSGGEFGAEASVVTVLLCLALSIYATRRAMLAGQIRTPFWSRPKPTPSDLRVHTPT